MALAYVLAGVAVALLVAILALLAAIYAEVRRGRRAVEVLAGSGRLLGQRVFYLHDDPSSGRAAGPAPPGSAPAPSSVARGRAAPPGELAPVRAGEVRGPVTSPEAVGTRAGDLSADGAPPSRGPSRVPGPSAAHVGLAPPASAPVLPSGPAIIAAGLGARPKRAREETGEQPFDEDEPTQIGQQSTRTQLRAPGAEPMGVSPSAGTLPCMPAVAQVGAGIPEPPGAGADEEATISRGGDGSSRR